jgi:CheY-like chemotaxis protein
VIPTLMIVEDDEELHELYTAMLEPLDYRLVRVYSGEEALGRLEEVEPNLMILDILLGTLMGDAVFRRLRQEPRWRDLPVVIVSVLAEARCRERLEMDERAVFLRKPFRKEQLLAAVQRGLTTKEEEQGGG